jgi:hypothetical protein
MVKWPLCLFWVPSPEMVGGCLNIVWSLILYLLIMTMIVIIPLLIKIINGGLVHGLWGLYWLWYLLRDGKWLFIYSTNRGWIIIPYQWYPDRLDTVELGSIACASSVLSQFHKIPQEKQLQHGKQEFVIQVEHLISQTWRRKGSCSKNSVTYCSLLERLSLIRVLWVYNLKSQRSRQLLMDMNAFIHQL